jgi:hypothetical protein
MSEPPPPETSETVAGLSVERESVTEAEVRGAGVDLARDFPSASLAEFRRYPVLSEGGWFMAIKHR